MEMNGITLNKYLAQAGVCSRRKACELIISGRVTVNGAAIVNPAYRVQEGQHVLFGSKPIVAEKKVYILLNKPKNYVTTYQDDQKRDTVIDMVSHISRERLYPVGRLDMQTTGLIVITNDGDIAQRLAHPKNMIEKTYVVIVDQPIKRADIDDIKKGVFLADGFIRADRVIQLHDTKVKVSLHSGRYRIIRRLFKKFGYNVLSLDRIGYAGLTKKGLYRGDWRFLTKKEIDLLKKRGTVAS